MRTDQILEILEVGTIVLPDAADDADAEPEVVLPLRDHHADERLAIRA